MNKDNNQLEISYWQGKIEQCYKILDYFNIYLNGNPKDLDKVRKKINKDCDLYRKQIAKITEELKCENIFKG